MHLLPLSDQLTLYGIKLGRVDPWLLSLFHEHVFQSKDLIGVSLQLNLELFKLCILESPL